MFNCPKLFYRFPLLSSSTKRPNSFLGAIMLLNLLLSLSPEAAAVRYADVYNMSELAAASSKIIDGTS